MSSSSKERELKVLSFNVWGLAVVSKEKTPRIRAIAEALRGSEYDIVCLQEVWVYKDYEIIRNSVSDNLPFSRFFHTGALGSGLAIFTRFPLIAAQAFPYSLSGSPAHAIDGDFFVKKAAGSVVILHPVLGEVEIWNTHMHAAGENPPDTRQAHRIAESWQLANAIRSSAAKGRYVLCMGDFNSQPWSIPINIMRHHANMSDSYLDAHPSANAGPSVVDARVGVEEYGMSCDSRLNTWSASKPIPQNITDQGGKRLDYIFHCGPAVARRRPLIWGYRDDPDSEAEGSGGQTSYDADGWPTGDAKLEQGKSIPHSVQRAPMLRCTDSRLVFTELVPGHDFSYSDHFGLTSTFTFEHTQQNGSGINGPGPTASANSHESASKSTSSFTPLVPLMSTHAEPLTEESNTYAPVMPATSSSPSSPRTSTSRTAAQTDKSQIIRKALATLRDYTRISQKGAKNHLRIFVVIVLALIGLTIGSAWQPKSWIQPIFTLLGGACGAAGATFLYTGFVWGKWELGLLTETMEEMELELRVVEMEERPA
ncbi:Endonuclease/exonuclease/phosphatase [Kockovaella imperatae]|uniref:Endonuclease/exonuclease/phosphatase n=1 Tax=Kockovaella imperatae TaxID=4999 RepID=A0A1Y1UEJ9_9TREE|nr:Endonuclease/exonuclease/phosphatase [Kockovaella imperatae]ORX36491.1 Endonuclease/exonuclease/phosphatase [Kockovaella imperatae]